MSIANTALQMPGDRGDIAARPDLMILVAHLGRSIGQHFARRLRIDEPLKPPLAQWVESNDRHCAPPCRLRRMERARTIASNVLAEEQDTLRRLDIVLGDRS